MVQILDNDGDGCPDDIKVLNKMIENKTCMVMGYKDFGNVPSAFKDKGY